MVLFAILFSVTFLDMKRYDRLFYRILLGLGGLLAAFFVASMLLPYRHSMTGSAALALIVVICAITAGVRVFIFGNRNARLYLLACGLFLVGSLVYLLKSFGALPQGVVTDWSLQGGSAAMVLLLSLALAERIRRTTSELEATKIRLEKRTHSLEDMMNSARSMSSELFSIGTDQERISRTFSEMSQEQASMSEEMSAAFEELTAAMETIQTSGQNQVAERERVGAMVEDLRTTRQTVISMSTDVLSSVKEISQSADETGGNMKLMEDVIHIIADGGRTVKNFMSVIDDITDKINLLSLNASIEAARAGEAGRGFAVVADEIGKLATATVDNSKEISGQIGSIIKDIDSSLNIMRNTRGSIEKIFEGIGLINGKVQTVAREMETLGAVITGIVGQADMLDAMTRSIAVSTSEHRMSMEESGKMVFRISEMAAAMARSTDEIVRFASLMLGRAKELDQMIGENARNARDA
jgi:methyl-accepting chemotaxis protein